MGAKIDLKLDFVQAKLFIKFFDSIRKTRSKYFKKESNL